MSAKFKTVVSRCTKCGYGYDADEEAKCIAHERDGSPEYECPDCRDVVKRTRCSVFPKQLTACKICGSCKGLSFIGARISYSATTRWVYDKYGGQNASGQYETEMSADPAIDCGDTDDEFESPYCERCNVEDVGTVLANEGLASKASGGLLDKIYEISRRVDEGDLTEEEFSKKMDEIVQMVRK